MKRIIGMLMVALAVTATFNTTAKAEKVEGVEINRTAQGINFTQSIDMSRYRTAGVQAVYSDGTPATNSIASGGRASATITIGNNPSGLIGAQASLTINVISSSTVTNDSVVLNGVVFREGTNWSALTSSSTSAANLAARIDAYPDFAATSLGSTVTVSYVLYGISGNGLAATTTDATNLALSAATFTGGINQYSIFINGTELKVGTAFNANSSSATTSHNIVTAINADTTINTQVIASSASATPGIVTVKAIAPGYSNYNLGSSTTGFLTSGGFPGGPSSDVDLTNDLINKTNHALTTGLKVLLVTTAGTIPTGLTTGTTYYSIKLNENQYALATTSTTAAAGTKINLTAVTNNSTTDVRPLALSLAANSGFYWQGSNDNTNFASLSVSSVTYTASGNTLWEFSPYVYKFLRMNFTGPTNGGISVTTTIYGIEE